MGKTNCRINSLTTAIFTGTLLSIFMFCGCANQKSQIHASQYRFNYEGEAYRIRSISAEDKTEFYNELVGANFLAVDFDQDRVIDRIMLGEASLNAAQKIYDYGLDQLTRENRLQLRLPVVQRYVHEGCDTHREIISFRPANAPPFNEFKIVDKRQMVSPDLIVVVDQNADGKLDEVLKGTIKLEDAQSQYAEAIEAGLQRGELIKVNHTILVKEK